MKTNAKKQNTQTVEMVKKEIRSLVKKMNEKTSYNRLMTYNKDLTKLLNTYNKVSQSKTNVKVIA